MPVTEIQNENDFKNALSHPLAIIDFYAEWCGPCKVMAPKFKEFSDNAKYSKVKFYKVNIDKVPEAGDKCEVKSLPTFFALEYGKQFDSVTGANPEKLKALLDDLISN
jgi:thioredoxin 1